MNELAIFLSTKLGIACDYVEDNFNEILTTYARYKVTSNIIMAIACALFIILAIVYIIICYKSSAVSAKYHDVFYEKDYDDLRSGPCLIFVIFSVLGIIAFVFLISSVSNAIGWSMSPLLKLVENVR